MSILTTPLQIGYFIGLMFAIIFWYRSYKDERHSDLFLGFVMFFLAMTLQDYTFGFAGINYLWEEMNGFPRYFALAFAPTVWFYLRAQLNRRFRFTFRDSKHYLPYFLYLVFNLVVFFSGSENVQRFQSSDLSHVLGLLEKVGILLSYGYYFYQSLKIYHAYRLWTETQFSNQDTISFLWLRNFIYLIIAGEIFKWGWYFADYILNMKFEDDWWWHLFTVAITLYVGIVGFAQPQPLFLCFNEKEELPKADPLQLPLETNESQDMNPISENVLSNSKGNVGVDYDQWQLKLSELMENEKPYLNPDLSLTELAKVLKTNTTILSAVINQRFGRNFNDFINAFRIEEFLKLSKHKDYRNFTILAIAYDCGFNSKATFNRAAKKIKNSSPSELIK